MAATAGQYVVWYLRKQEDGSLSQEFAGIWKDRWLCVLQQLRSKMNNEEEGEIYIECFNALDHDFLRKVTKFSECKRWELEDQMKGIA